MGRACAQGPDQAQEASAAQRYLTEAQEGQNSSARGPLRVGLVPGRTQRSPQNQPRTSPKGWMAPSFWGCFQPPAAV